MKPYFDDGGGRTIFHADNREVLPTLEVGAFDVVLTDPPFRNRPRGVAIRGKGVAPRRVRSVTVAAPWGVYSEEWIDLCSRLEPDHWIVYGNQKMLGSLCSRLEPQTLFVWRKRNAPLMVGNVPRLDCEFVIWSRTPGASCGDMGEFDSQVIDVPIPVAGCFAVERILEPGSKRAFHPCQKPLAIVQVFIDRLRAKSVLDPFLGTGTTLIAAKLAGASGVGIEREERFCEMAALRLSQEGLGLAAPGPARRHPEPEAWQIGMEEAT